MRGLNDESKQVDLARDINNYGIDIASMLLLQETKIKKGCNETVEKCLLECLPTKEKAYGLGFIVNNDWKQHIHKQWKVSDRIAVLQLTNQHQK